MDTFAKKSLRTTCGTKRVYGILLTCLYIPMIAAAATAMATAPPAILLPGAPPLEVDDAAGEAVVPVELPTHMSTHFII